MNKSEQVYNYLKSRILSGELEAGAPIKINEVEETLSISKIPVREAIRKLEANGLVEVIHNSGARVKTIDLNELEQIVLIRQKLEVLAIGLSAENIEKAEIAALDEFIEHMEECVKNNDKKKYSEINREFHMAIYRGSKANILVDLIQNLWDRSERTTMIFELFPSRFFKSNSEHREIVKCLENRDRENAEKILNNQKEEGFLNIVRILKEYERLRANGA